MIIYKEWKKYWFGYLGTGLCKLSIPVTILKWQFIISPKQIPWPSMLLCIKA